MSSAYADVLARLVSARRFGVVLGLDRMRALLDALGSPDAGLGRVIHVGGTNGKGSTVAMLAHLARTAGLRVAAYTSPHLCTLRERIAIDGAMISEEAFVDAASGVASAGGDELTFFEQVTAIACVAIADARVDVTILEVGLGGRLDATNAIAADVAVVTGVAMDHEAILGDTLAKIAAEKAGIFKRGQRIVIGASGLADAVPILAAAARAVGVEPVVVDEAMIARVPPVSLAGEHQRANAACALAAIDALVDDAVANDARANDAVANGAVANDAVANDAVANDAHVPTWAQLRDSKTRVLALSTVLHPGRFEILRDPKLRPRTDLNVGLGLVILDGAHNPHGASALARTLLEREIRPTLVLAVSADKDARAIVRELLPAVGDVVVTRYQQDRAMDPRELQTHVAHVAHEVLPRSTNAPLVLVHDSKMFYRGELVEPWDAAAALLVTSEREPPREPGDAAIVSIYIEDDIAHALYRASRIAAPIVVAGSLFIVGEARSLLLGVPTDPILATDPAVRRS
jgi:dihydrofolate synthase/folylpolyglutamate synthase